jgi:enediyne polyketide synthase
METVTTLRPGAELVAEARVSARTDPYLADYLIDGRAVLPAAIGLEAMAQAASALARQPMRSARGVTLGPPVVIAEAGQVLLRVQARVTGDGVETVLQAGSGGRLAEHARAVFVGSGGSSPAASYLGAPVAGDTTTAPGRASGPGLEAGPPTRSASTGGASRIGGNGAGRSAGALIEIADEAGIVDGTDLYGPVCFQTGRFRRVALVSGTPPASCRAIVRGRDDLPWFGCVPALTDLLVLGSPGVNDAVLQVVQACVPHRRLLPGGCDSLTVSGTEVPGAVELRVFLVSASPGTAAFAPASQAGRYRDEAGSAGSVWDVHGYDAAGHPVAAWIGLRMRDAGPLRPGRNASPDMASAWWDGAREPALIRPAGDDGTIRAAYIAREPVP